MPRQRSGVATEARCRGRPSARGASRRRCRAPKTITAVPARPVSPEIGAALRTEAASALRPREVSPSRLRQCPAAAPAPAATIVPTPVVPEALVPPVAAGAEPPSARSTTARSTAQPHPRRSLRPQPPAGRGAEHSGRQSCRFVESAAAPSSVTPAPRPFAAGRRRTVHRRRLRRRQPAESVRVELSPAAATPRSDRPAHAHLRRNRRRCARPSSRRVRFSDRRRPAPPPRAGPRPPLFLRLRPDRAATAAFYDHG